MKDQIGLLCTDLGPDLWLAFIGQCDPMRELQALVRSMSHRVCHVLLEGEPGTGRQFMGRWIHDQGPLAAKPFIPIDLATVRGPLSGGELFGHAKRL